MMTIIFMIPIFLFMYFLHPLWTSMMVFVISIMMSLFKFFMSNSMNMFSFLFVLAYSGGLLIMLVYMSSLVPNNNMNLNLYTYVIFLFLIIFSVYTEKYIMFNNNFNFIDNSFSVVNYIINNKELVYMFLFLLLLSFCMISVILDQFKYPLRSL